MDFEIKRPKVTHAKRMTLHLSILPVGAAGSFNMISNSHCYIKAMSRGLPDGQGDGVSTCWWLLRLACAARLRGTAT